MANLSEEFWSSFSDLLVRKLSTVDNQDDCLKIMENFINLFKNFSPNSVAKSKEHLISLTKHFFDKFYYSFMISFNETKRSLEMNKKEMAYLNGLNKICMHLHNPIFVDWFLAKNSNTADLYFDQKLNIFNNDVIGSFVKTIMNRNTNTKDYSLYLIINLYLTINLKLNKRFSTLSDNEQKMSNGKCLLVHCVHLGVSLAGT